MAEVAADSGYQIMAFKELLVFVLVLFRPLLWVMSSFFLPQPLV